MTNIDGVSFYGCGVLDDVKSQVPPYACANSHVAKFMDMNVERHPNWQPTISQHWHQVEISGEFMLVFHELGADHGISVHGSQMHFVRAIFAKLLWVALQTILVAAAK